MHRKSFWLGYLLGVVLLLGLSAGTFYFTFIYQRAISLTAMDLVDLHNQPVAVAQWQGQPVIVNYWATWCIPCVEEFPLFEQARQRVGKRVVFLMVSDEPVAKVRAFAQKHPYGFTFLCTRKAFPGVNVRPVTYVYSKDGTLLDKHAGTVTAGKLQAILSDLQ